MGLRRAIGAALRPTTGLRGPVLDLFCGTKPYAELIPTEPIWGVDLDDHFGRADVLGSLPLPFRDGTFGIVFCSQALHLVDDPLGTVSEMARVLRDDGVAIVTVPHLFLAEGDFERHWSRRDVSTLFAGWRDVRIAGIDGPGVALAFLLGRIGMLAARRFRVLRPLAAPGFVALNAVCTLVDVLTTPVHGRWPQGLVVVARPPADHQGAGR